MQIYKDYAALSNRAQYGDLSSQAWHLVRVNNNSIINRCVHTVMQTRNAKLQWLNSYYR
jgi:hypothetical protein